MLNILILNGPNLNLLGVRETEIYGYQTLEEIIGNLKEKHTDCNIQHFQSNHEGVIIDKLHEVGFSWDGIILNAGAYTHTSIAIADAVKAISTPVIELHISDITKRESFRKHSYLTENCIHVIHGQGVVGYDQGVTFFKENLGQQKT